jgi:hypothetical protein
MKSKRAADDVKPKVAEFFKECLKVNEERVRVAHGDWTLNGARVVSRGSRKAEIYFKEPKELVEWSKRCEALAKGYYGLMQ